MMEWLGRWHGGCCFWWGFFRGQLVSWTLRLFRQIFWCSKAVLWDLWDADLLKCAIIKVAGSKLHKVSCRFCQVGGDNINSPLVFLTAWCCCHWHRRPCDLTPATDAWRHSRCGGWGMGCGRGCCWWHSLVVCMWMWPRVSCELFHYQELSQYNYVTPVVDMEKAHFTGHWPIILCCHDVFWVWSYLGVPWASL